MHILQTSSTKTRVEPAPTWKASNTNMYIVYADHNPIHWIHLSQFSDQETNPKRYFLVKSSLGFNVYGGQTEQNWLIPRGKQ